MAVLHENLLCDIFCPSIFGWASMGVVFHFKHFIFYGNLSGSIKIIVFNEEHFYVYISQSQLDGENPS